MQKTQREMIAQAEKAQHTHREQAAKIAELKEAVRQSQLDLEEERRVLNEERAAFEERLLATASTHATEIEREIDRQMGEEHERRVLHVTEQAASGPEAGPPRGWQAWHSDYSRRVAAAAVQGRDAPGAARAVALPGALEEMWQAG